MIMIENGSEWKHLEFMPFTKVFDQNDWTPTHTHTPRAKDEKN